MVTELDKLKRAQEYMAKLAEGIDPITDTKLPGDTALGHVRLSRCFSYVAGVLSEMIEGYGKKVARGENLSAFSITEEELARIKVSDAPVNITTLIRMIAEAAPGRRKLAVTAVTGWLAQEGYLKTVAGDNGKGHKEVAPKGADLGIFSEMRDSPSGRYMAVLYPPEAQRLILGRINDILAFVAAKA